MTNRDYDRSTEDDVRTHDLRSEEGLRDDGLRDEDLRDDDLRADDDVRGREGYAEGTYADDRHESGHGMDSMPHQQASNQGNGRPALVDDSGELLERWQHVQARFVDSPRESVSEASDIVTDVLDRLSRSFDSERRRLDDVWESGGEPSTEDLRVALQRYRSFFERLLAA